MPGRLNEDLYINGKLGAKQIDLPDGTVDDDAVAGFANINYAKLQHLRALNYKQAPGANIAAATEDLIVCFAAGGLASIQAAITGVIPGGDRTVSIDIHKSTGGGAFATVLSAPLVLDSGNSLRVPEEATIASANLAADDIIRIIVTVAGTTGTQPQGLIVTLNQVERAQ